MFGKVYSKLRRLAYHGADNQSRATHESHSSLVNSEKSRNWKLHENTLVAESLYLESDGLDVLLALLAFASTVGRIYCISY